MTITIPQSEVLKLLVLFEIPKISHNIHMIIYDKEKQQNLTVEKLRIEKALLQLYCSL